MKFTEAQLEADIIEFLGIEGNPHVLGEAIECQPQEVLEYRYLDRDGKGIWGRCDHSTNCYAPDAFQTFPPLQQGGTVSIDATLRPCFCSIFRSRSGVLRRCLLSKRRTHGDTPIRGFGTIHRHGAAPKLYPDKNAPAQETPKKSHGPQSIFTCEAQIWQLSLPTIDNNRN